MFIRWKQQLGLKECPYMERWVINFYFFTLRVHHWFRSDDAAYFHDHPWWFWTFVVKGWYTDSSPEGFKIVGTHTLHYRPAEHKHTVFIDPKIDTWTICLTGPVNREWGFWVNNKLVKAKNYFFRYGHHPCEDGGKRQRTFERN